jgi:hypothetical protein
VVTTAAIVSWPNDEAQWRDVMSVVFPRFSGHTEEFQKFGPIFSSLKTVPVGSYFNLT